MKIRPIMYTKSALVSLNINSQVHRYILEACDFNNHLVASKNHPSSLQPIPVLLVPMGGQRG